MAKFLNLGAAWFNHQYNFISCMVTKGDKISIYDQETRQSEEVPAELILRNTVTGEEIKVTNFAINENKNKKSDKAPDYNLTIKL